MLDCGCNAGGYSFLARELGAGRCFGFDVREHWIRQARFIAEARRYEDMAFEVADLYELQVEPFDVTIFGGLLYGYLAVENESAELPLSGVYGLNWLPTGPEVLRRMLEWVGFPETRAINHRPISDDTNRLGMVASKVPGLLAHIPDRPELTTE